MAEHERYFSGWATEQVALLRAGRLDVIDLAGLAEEIESMGRSEKRELVDGLAVLLTRRLNWKLQPGLRGVSWRLTIEEQRCKLQDHLADNPCLAAQLDEAFGRAYRQGARAAQRESGLAAEVFPATNPWAPAQVLDASVCPQ